MKFNLIDPCREDAVQIPGNAQAPAEVDLNAFTRDVLSDVAKSLDIPAELLDGEPSYMERR